MNQYKVTGHFFEKNKSKAHKAEVHLHDNNTVSLIVYRDEQESSRAEVIGTFPYTQLSIDNNLGNIPREITFPNGHLFSPFNNTYLDDWISAQPSTFGSWLHKFETEKRYIFTALIIAPVLLFLTFTKGVPFLSEKIAHSFDTNTIVDTISFSVEDIADIHSFAEYSLSEQKIEQTNQLFTTALSYANAQNYNYKLYYYNLSDRPMMMNAFALPNGNIVVTEEILKQLSEEELLSVLLHEIGHVEKRHGVQMLIEYSLSAVFYSFLFGSQDDIQNILVSVNNMLIQKNFSRTMESDADTFALTKLKASGISPMHFATALQKLKDSEDSLLDHPDNEPVAEPSSEEKQDTIFEMFSTHPNIDNRIERAKNAAKNDVKSH